MRPFSKVTTMLACFLILFFLLTTFFVKGLNLINAPLLIIGSLALAYIASNLDMTYPMKKTIVFPLMTIFLANKIPEIIQWFNESPSALPWVIAGTLVYLYSIKEFFSFASIQNRQH